MVDGQELGCPNKVRCQVRFVVVVPQFTAASGAEGWRQNVSEQQLSRSVAVRAQLRTGRTQSCNVEG